MRKVITKRTVKVGHSYEVSTPEVEVKSIKEAEEHIKDWWKREVKDKEAK